MQTATFENPDIAQVFATYPAPLQVRLLALRALIFAVAADLPDIGTLEETLKWGQPAYITPSKTGSTIRIDVHDADRDEIALYVHCQSKLIETFKTRYPDTFCYEGKRALIFAADETIDDAALRDCIGLALTYHRWK